MANHFWLVWYRVQSPLGPKHWSLFVTYETDEQAPGTIYQVRLALATRQWIVLIDAVHVVRLLGRGKWLGHRPVRLQNRARLPAQGCPGKPGVRGAALSGRHPRRRQRDAAGVLRGRDGDDQRTQRVEDRRRVQLSGLVHSSN